MIKLRKLVTEAMDLETRMQTRHGEASDGGYVAMYLHATTGDQSRMVVKEAPGQGNVNGQTCGQRLFTANGGYLITFPMR